jgi:hypothetical protein
VSLSLSLSLSHSLSSGWNPGPYNYQASILYLNYNPSSKRSVYSSATAEEGLNNRNLFSYKICLRLTDDGLLSVSSCGLPSMSLCPNFL